MATNRSDINIRNYSTSSIDYDDIKNDLKEFLRSQSTFTDYNFEGSGLSQIINLLAYNTHYNMVADNFAINESFIDTAVKKSSVISHANLLGYITRSARCPEAVVDVEVTYDSEDDIKTNGVSIVLNSGSAFTTTYDGSTYTFYTTDTYTSTQTGTTSYRFEDVKLYGGTPVSATYRYGNDYRTIELTSTNIDTTTIQVRIIDNGVAQSLSLCEDITAIDGDSYVYFLRETPNETYVISFGDGKLGVQLSIGAIITVSYMTSFGDACNGCTTFEPNFVLQNANVYVECITAASGGDMAEDIDDIRINAPRMYTTQNRCVTAYDYMSIIKANYPGLRSVSVWGGDEEDPPQYGKVFISAVKKDGTIITADEQEYIYNNIIKDRKEMTSIIEFSNPSYIGINVDTIVYYNPDNIVGSGESIKAIVTRAIESFCEDNIGGLNDKLKYSKLVTAIDNSNKAITSNDTSISLTYDFIADIDAVANYECVFNNAIHKSTNPSSDVQSSGFFCNEASGMCYIDDNPETSNLRLFYYNSLGEKIIIRNIGSVDYTSGKVSIEGIRITATNNASNIIRIMVNPEYKDVSSKKNQYSVLNTVNVSLVSV